jgi:predicted HAD superfamily Cof-like phosphohydrolase
LMYDHRITRKNDNTMKKEQQMVEEFHRTFDLNVSVGPSLEGPAVATRRKKLVDEELDEYIQAAGSGDIVGIADAIGDLLYVVLGMAVEHGIDIEPVFNEIHRSNMTKVGGHKNEYGKFVKPASYEPAQLERIVERQIRIANGI